MAAEYLFCAMSDFASPSQRRNRFGIFVQRDLEFIDGRVVLVQLAKRYS